MRAPQPMRGRVMGIFVTAGCNAAGHRRERGLPGGTRLPSPARSRFSARLESRRLTYLRPFQPARFSVLYMVGSETFSSLASEAALLPPSTCFLNSIA